MKSDTIPPKGKHYDLAAPLPGLVKSTRSYPKVVPNYGKRQLTDRKAPAGEVLPRFSDPVFISQDLFRYPTLLPGEPFRKVLRIRFWQIVRAVGVTLNLNLFPRTLRRVLGSRR